MSTAHAVAKNPKVRGAVYDMPHPIDDQVERNRFTRMTSSLLTTSFLTLGPIKAGIYFSSAFLPVYPNANVYGILGGLALGALAVTSMSHRLMVYVEEWNGYVTQNALGRNMVVYGPGLHFAHPWEERNSIHNYSLQTVTVMHSVSVSTKTGRVSVNFVFTYARELSLLQQAIGASLSTINDGYIAYISSFLTANLATKKVDGAIKAVDELNSELATTFMGHVGEKEDTPADFEKNFGIHTVGLVIAGIELPQDMQTTRNSVDENKILFEAAAALYGLTPRQMAKRLAEGLLTYEQYKELLNRAMSNSKNVTMNMNVIETSGPMNQVLMALFGTKAKQGRSPRKGDTEKSST